MTTKVGAEAPGEIGFEDNFGCYDLTFPLEREFMAAVKGRSGPRVCRGCVSVVRLEPGRLFCTLCAFNLEHGWPVGREE